MPLTWPRRANWVFRAAQLSTDDQGRWSWSESPPDCSNVGIRIRHRDYLPTWSQATLSRDAVFIIQQGLQVKGRVFGPDKEPVIGAQVALGLDRFGTNEPDAHELRRPLHLKNCKPGRVHCDRAGLGCSPTFQEVEVGKEAPDARIPARAGPHGQNPRRRRPRQPVAEAGVAADLRGVAIAR